MIGGSQKSKEENRVPIDVTSLKGVYNASIPQEEETESHVYGVHYADMRDIGYPHLLPLIDCKRIDEDSYFYIIKNKARRREAKEYTQLRDNKDTKNGRRGGLLTMRTA